jgi:hypothetical protein
MTKMKLFGSRKFYIALSCLIFILAVGYLGLSKRGIPFISQREQWTIGIYRGETPFSFTNPLNMLNPILRAENVTDVKAKFVADPFLMKEGDTWYLFFEVYNLETDQGDLAVATSKNTWIWDYQKVCLDEPFHLSYPYVFKWEDNYYMIPESYQDDAIRLYKASDFPVRWSFVTKLVSGRDYVDNSIVHFNGQWWLFASVTSNDTLYLFYADELTGPWTEHPSSPIVKEDNHKARPSGRLLIYEDHLYRYTMDINPPSGTHQVVAYHITSISPTSYSEELVQEDPILKASGSGWNAQAMHQIDPVEIRPGQWIASVDGYGKYLIFDLDH